ncbi:MAG: hypothetical protein LBG43_09320 [Treponema sp.]|jgi:hypothetical protein|nr:hypothetical protein [Treponema sp.]
MAMEAFEQSNGFSALTADELFFVNGGSFNISLTISGSIFGATVSVSITVGW